MERRYETMKTQQKVFTRLAALLLLCIVAAAAMPTASAAGWDYYRAIEIDSGEVSGGADLLSFPVLIDLTADWLKYEDTSGNVRQADGYDIVFTDVDNTTLLDYEIEEYNGTAGTLVAWVRIPTLDYDENTKIRLWYGNSAATDWSNAAGVWDSNYKSVWHLLGDGTTSLPESTSNSNTGTKLSATEPANTASGQIDGAQDFDGANDDMTAGTTGFNMQRGTYEAWLNFDDWANNEMDVIFSAPSEAAATCAGLVGYWRGDTIESNIVTDISENGNDGTIFGTGGTAESGTDNTLTDDDQTWDVDEWAGETIYINGGKGIGQERTVDSNTATVITVTPDWNPCPDNTSEYTITPGTDLAAAGRFGVAVGFDGIKGYIDVGDINEYAETVSLWFKPTATIDYTSDPQCLISLKDRETGDSYYLVLGSITGLIENELIVVVTNLGAVHTRSAYETTDVSLTPVWYHLAFVRSGDAENFYIYLDGVKVNNAVSGAPPSAIIASNVLIGKTQSVNPIFFNCTIDDVRIYNAAISEDRIRSQYLGGLSAHKNEDNNLVLNCGNATMTTSVSGLSGWHHVAATYDNSPGKAYIYLDGVQKAEAEFGGGTRRIFGDYAYLGNDENNQMQFDGKMDEARISATARSGDWINTSHNNQHSPGTFYSVGVSTSAPEGTDPVPDPSAMVLFAVGLVMLIVFFGWTKRRGGVK